MRFVEFSVSKSNRLPSVRFLSRASLLGWLAGALLGCGGDSRRAAVEGKIAVDNATLENGVIRFSPTDGNTGPTAGVTVTNGRYFVDAKKGPTTGWNRISISGSRKTGKRIPDPLVPGKIVDEVVPAVPDQYGDHSTFKREIKSGKNVLDFDLSSK